MDVGTEVGVVVGVVDSREILKLSTLQATGFAPEDPSLEQSFVPTTLQLKVPLGTWTVPRVAD